MTAELNLPALPAARNKAGDFESWAEVYTSHEVESIRRQAIAADRAQQASAAAPSDLLTADEMAALCRFDECAQDGEGYDVPKAMMRRLSEIGVVQRLSGAYYHVTEFGMSVLASPAQASAAPSVQASQGAGSIDEILKGIDEQEVQSEHGWWETSVGAAFGAQKLAEVKAWAARCVGDAVADDMHDAVEALLDVLDGYGEQLVPINRKSATVSRLREAFTAATQHAAATPQDQGAKSFAAPGAWFPIDVLGHPMREYEPGKWENAIWPSASPAQASAAPASESLHCKGAWAWEQRAKAAERFLQNYADTNMEVLLDGYQVQPIIRRLAAAILEWQQAALSRGTDELASAAPGQAQAAVPASFKWPEPPAGGQSHVLFDDGYAEGWAKAIATVKAMVAASPEPATAAVPKHDTELTQLRAQNMLLVRLYDAVAKLVKAKGRFHTEQNYGALVAAYDLVRTADVATASTTATKPAAQPVEQPADDARDAARYRWLRNNALNTYGICPVVVMVGEDCKPVPDDIDSSGFRYEENLDAAIDVAMQASKGATDGAVEDRQ